MKHRIALAIAAGGLWFLSGCGGYTFSDVKVSITPPDPTINACATRQYSANVYGSPPTGIAWEVNEKQGGDTTIGTISVDGNYIAPCTVPNPAAVRIGVAKSGTAQDGTTQLTVLAEVQVTILGNGSGGGGGNSAPTVSITVSPLTINQGLSATLIWSSSNCPDTGATINGNMTINGIAVGSLGQTQVSPSTTTSYVYSCTNSSGADSKTATLTVQPTGGGGTPTISISPASSTLTEGKTEAIAANVTNDPSGSGVTWSASAGSISEVDALHANYTAPASVAANTNVTIAAALVSDPTVKTTATITVVPTSTSPNVQVNVTPGLLNLPPNYPYTIKCAVTGATVTNPRCIWSVQAAQGVPDPGTIQASADGTTAVYTSPVVTGTTLATARITAASEQYPQSAGYCTVYTAVGNPIPPPQK